MDPTRPLQVTVEIDSPQVVVYRLWFRKPGDAQFTIFATGTDEAESSQSGHTHVVGPLPAGSEIRNFFLFSGNPNTAYRARVTAAQDGAPLPGAEADVTGTTDSGGVAGAEGEVPL